MITRIDERLIHLFCFFLLIFGGQGCARDTLTSTWVDESFKGPIKGKILVIGVFKNQYAYKIFEDSFVNGLVKSGADAVPSYKYSQGGTRHSKEWLHQAVKESGATAVLVTHLSNETKQTEIFAPRGIILGGEMYGNDLNGYQGFFVEKNVVPEDIKTRTVDFIDVTIFDSQTKKAIWSSRSKSVNLNHLVRADDEQLESLFIQDLKRDHLL